MIDGVIKWAIKNRYLVNTIALIWLAFGIYSMMTMPVDVFPDFSPVQVVVLTEAPGFAPEEVESLVTRPIEVGLNGTANVKLVRSTSTVGLSVITVIFDDGTNIFTARQLVSEKLQTTRSKLPASVQEPNLAPLTSAAGDILKIGLYSTGQTSMMDLRTLVDWTLKMRLLAVQGVSNVVVIGGEVKQYQVLVDPEKLREYDVSLTQAIDAAAGSNVNAAGGILRNAEKESIIRGIGRVNSPEEIAQAVVTSRGGTPVTLNNIADIKIGPEFKIGDAIVDGHRGVVLTVYKQPWANTLITTKAIEATLNQVQSTLPADVKLVTTFRQADFIEVAIKNVGEAVILGGILVAVILFAFLQNWRTAVISLTAIPLSLLSAIIILKLQGYTINTMTLGGLAIAIGEVVDDAIIDVENVFHRLRENSLSEHPQPVWQVIYKASVEVRSAVVYATFIVGLVFLPVLSLGGLEGKIFSPLAYSYILSLFCSLAVALTVTPALSYLLLHNLKSLPSTETSLVQLIKGWYQPVLQLSIKNPKLVIGGAIVLFVISMTPLTVLGSTFLPEFDENNLIVVTNSMPGTSLETTVKTGESLLEHLKSKHDIMAASQRAGRAEGGEDYGSGNFSEFDIRLKPDSKNKKDILYHLRHEFAHIPGLISDSGSYLQHRMDHALSGVNAAVAIKIFGDDLNVLHEKAREIESLMKGVNGAVDVHVEPIVPVPQIAIKVNRNAAARYGLSVKDLSKTMEAAFRGAAVSQVLEDQRAFDIYVWLKPAFRNRIDVIKNTLVDTPIGAKVPLSALADIVENSSPNTISHENISRRVYVQANVSGRDLGSVIAETRAKVYAQIKLPPGYYVVYGGQFEAQEQATRQLSWLSLAALLGMFLLLTMAFKSTRAALLIMANLPLALIGGIWAVLFSGAVVSVGSLVGFITLFGISTRNGIMLVSHYNQLKAGNNNGSEDELIMQSALDRISPVLMTALTAALGVLPIAIMGGAGRELEQPLAIVILGGMLSSTALTLIVIPALLKLFGRQIQPAASEEISES
jgi:CzcA family heavy metal efflux pump